MSAILSLDDLNDFISPGVACIKPVETLPAQRPDAAANASNEPYQVTTEEQLAESAPAAAQNAQISLTDCLACSGCVTSAEAVLISLQSHEEVLNTLDANQELSWQEAARGDKEGLVFVASVSPQTRANIAALYGTSEAQAGCMIEQLLRGPQGVRTGGRHGSGFSWVLDTNGARDLCLEAGIQEALSSTHSAPSPLGGAATAKKPILASSCPGWICYAEKTHAHVLPYISRLKSPQAMTGTLVKAVLSRRFGIAPDKVWHVAVMPCFDKKLEASREELTDAWWRPDARDRRGVRDVDCVITARELVMLADSRGISMARLANAPLETPQPPFPDEVLDQVLFSRHGRRRRQTREEGPSGGYAHHILRALQAQTPGRSAIQTVRGRNVDVVEYLLVRDGEVLAKTARYYGFRNIQNLVRALKPAKASRLPGSRQRTAGGGGGGGGGARGGGLLDYAYVEVMACPGGCTNGGGQIKAGDVAGLRGEAAGGEGGGVRAGPAEQKQWLARVDEAYFSADDGASEEAEDGGEAAGAGAREDAAAAAAARRLGVQRTEAKRVLQHVSAVTEIAVQQLVLTSYRAVESDVGKSIEQVAATAGGGW